MKSKLVIWSWILPIIGYGLYIIYTFLHNREAGIDLFLIVLLVLGSTIIGMVFGIIGLIKISRNSNLKGKGHAIIGTVLSAILLLYGIFMFLGGVLGG